MAHRFAVKIEGYMIADSLTEVTERLEDVTSTGLNIEFARADEVPVWIDPYAASAGVADD